MAAEQLSPVDVMNYRRVLAQYFKAVGFNLDQDVKQYKDACVKKTMTCRVRRVVSPFEFYLELANLPEPRVYSKWFAEMQEFYNEEENRDKYKVFRDIPIIGRCYVCRDFTDAQWHRVRLHKIKETGSITVFYMDQCKLQAWSKGVSLLELDPKFAKAPAQVFKCYLSSVLPKDDPNSLKWSEKACQYFKELMKKDKEYHGVVMTRSENVVNEGLPDYYANMGVVLVGAQPAQGSGGSKMDDCTLNAMMVDAGFAVAIGVGGGCRHSTEIEGFVPAFDQSEFVRVHHEILPSGFFNVKDTAQAPAPGNLKVDEVPSEKLVLCNGMKFEDAEKQGYDTPMAYYKNGPSKFPAVLADRLAFVKLTFVKNPAFIVVQLKSQIPELKEMERGLQQLVEGEEPLVGGEPGTFVAVNILDKQDNPMWCRGIIREVVKVENGERYNVILVDYGTENKMMYTDFVRRLPPYFQDIPSFGILVHLDVETVAPADGSHWSDAASKQFRRYIAAFQDEEPRYFMYRPRNGKVLDLQYYGQNVMLNGPPGGKTEWTTVKGENPPSSHEIVDKLKDHPMLHSLYVSFGMELQYEIMIVPPNPSNFWHFKTVLDNLWENGLVDKVRLSKDSNRIHMELSKDVNVEQRSAFDAKMRELKSSSSQK